jgi:hypothetical protein
MARKAQAFINRSSWQCDESKEALSEVEQQEIVMQSSLSATSGHNPATARLNDPRNDATDDVSLASLLLVVQTEGVDTIDASHQC